MLLPLACGDSQFAADVEKLRARAGPWIERFDSIQAALPPTGAEKELAPAAAVDGSDGKLLFIDEALLGHLTDKKPLEGEALERATWFASMGLSSMIPPSAYEAVKRRGNYRPVHAAWDPVNALDVAEHLVVMRTAELVEGQVGEQLAPDQFVFKQVGRWKGWVFVHELKTGMLFAAFPAEAANSEQVSARQTAGTQFNDMWLKLDLTGNVEKAVRARIVAPH